MNTLESAPATAESSFSRRLAILRPVHPVRRLLGGIAMAFLATPLWAAPFSGGSGTSVDPYQIATLNDLRTLSETSSYWNKHFVQTADIDAADTANWNVGDHDANAGTADVAMGFAAIGGTDCSLSFTGSYDGRGHVISNLYQNRIKRPTGQVQTMCTGLFANITHPGGDAPFVKNLGIVAATVRGESSVGILAGVVNGYSSAVLIENVYTTGTVQANAINAQGGGLVGDNNGAAISNSYSRAAVSGGSGFSGIALGGLCGVLRSNMPASITNSYAAGTVSAGTYLGGLAGVNFGAISGSLWDTDTSSMGDAYGFQNSPGSTTNSSGETTANMKTAATFTAKGWDFAAVWQINGGANSGYPDLRPYQPPNAAPTASSVAISGSAQVGVQLSGSYVYGDTDADAQGTSTFRWMSDSVAGAGATKAAIALATAATYTPVAGDLGRILFFCATPVASAGNSPGTEVCSSATSAVAAAVVNGSCGTADGVASAFAPAGNLLCANGSAGAVSAGSPWTWSCAGSGGGTTASCSAPNATTATNTGNGRATVAASNGWVVDQAGSAGFIPMTGHAKSPLSQPAGYTFPHGLVDLRLTTGAVGSAATVTLTYPNPLPPGTVYWKYGRTTANPVAHWYQFPGAVIAGNTVTLTLTDGGDGDDDLTPNSVILDPGAPGVPGGVADIPTLSEWGLILLSMLMGTFALVRIRRAD